MANIIYEDVIPSMIPNTTMQKRLVDGVIRNFIIEPIDGYVLHDNGWDSPVLDENGNETGEVILGYRTYKASVGATYDFSTTQVAAVDGSIVTAYGPREFYAIPASLVPENQIFGSTPSNPPEIA